MKTALLLTISSLMVCCAPPASTADNAALPKVWPRSAQLESSWGPARGPSLQLNGTQAMSYTKKGARYESIHVCYLGQKQPREIVDFNGKHASDGKLSIMGQMVDFYGSGNEEAEITTQPMLLTSPSGWSGWFTFDFSDPEHLKGKNIPAFSW